MKFDYCRSGRGATALSFPGAARDWDPARDETKRLRVTLRFNDDPNSGIVLSDVRAGSLEEAAEVGNGGSSYKKKGSRDGLMCRVDLQICITDEVIMLRQILYKIFMSRTQRRLTILKANSCNAQYLIIHII